VTRLEDVVRRATRAMRPFDTPEQPALICVPPPLHAELRGWLLHEGRAVATIEIIASDGQARHLQIFALDIAGRPVASAEVVQDMSMYGGQWVEISINLPQVDVHGLRLQKRG